MEKKPEYEHEHKELDIHKRERSFESVALKSKVSNFGRQDRKLTFDMESPMIHMVLPSK